ncbi:MAG: aminotransferase class IV [Armatimonadetes bacterium]|nr:aminotransferase class IV [Armatimonadota bacterium]
MKEIAYLNGDFTTLDEASISVNDRGYLFGDGVYEVIRGYGGRLWTFERHWQRLARSLAELRIEGVDLDALEKIARECVRRAETAEPLLYVQITRGIAPRSHFWETNLVPSILVTVREFRGPSEQARREGVSCITTLDTRWKRCDIKSLNLLPNVMAKQEAHLAGAFEAVFRDENGTITEGSSTSLGIVSGGALLLHPAGSRVLPSISRDLVCELAGDRGLEVRQQAFDLAALLGADEAFLAGTTTEVVAVVKVDGQPICNGRPGATVSYLIEAYADAVRRGADAPRC